jgi:hypothetical protein
VSQISAATVRFLLPAGGEGEYAAAVSRTEGAMRHEEYERRRRAIEAQLREDLELLRAGYQAKLRALEMLWLAPPGEALPPAGAMSETLRLSETPASSETLPETTLPQSETVTPSDPKETRRGQVREEIEAAFAELPEEFDRRDILRVLGYEPPRATLFRVLRQLVEDEWITVAWYSTGRSSTRYAKLPEPAEETV